MVRSLWLFGFLFLLAAHPACTQSLPCSGEAFRQFDFWIGEWDVFKQDGTTAGDSRISVILDSCVILEEWTSARPRQTFFYKGKSFNTYNTVTKQWQQTWVDNTGRTTEFLRCDVTPGQLVFFADAAWDNSGKACLRRLTFTRLSEDRVRQFSECSYDDGKTWSPEYDLDYRRKKP